MKGRVIVVGATKGGVGKSVSSYNLAYSLANMGEKVLAVDFDSQANMSTCFGIEDPAAVSVTIGHLMMNVIEDEELLKPSEYIMSRNGVDFIPSSMVLSAVEAKLRLEMGAEKMLAKILKPLKGKYDWVIVDTCPSTGALTLNALAAADGVVITVNPQLLAMVGLQEFLKTVKKVKSRINPKLEVEGILLTMCEARTNLCRTVIEQVTETFEGQIRIFKSRIPNTVKVGESVYYSEPLLEYAPQSKACRAYQDFGKELMGGMKAKRKVFDAVDLLTGGEPEGGVQMLSVDAIEAFHDHPFRLYAGERLADMVESIKEHGVLTPVIVRKTDTGYEMLAGHNRQNAARMAGLKEIPAIVKEGLTDEEALVYVVETNVIQRSFSDLSISERIAVLATRYDRVCGTKKREEIMAELHALNGDGGHHVHRAAKSRELIGKEYGMTGRQIARYVRCGQLVQAFRDLLDEGTLTMEAGIELSYLSAEEQEAVLKVMERNCIRIRKDAAAKLRAAAGAVTEGKVQEILGLDKPADTGAQRPVSLKLPAGVYHRYFADVPAKDVQGIVEEALEQYFMRKGA